MRKKLLVWMILIGVILFVALVSILAATIYRDKIIMVYLVDGSLSAKELPEKWVRPAFEFVTGRELPTNAKELRAFFEGGRNPAIFVKFKASPESIENFLGFFLKHSVNEADPIFYAQGERWIPRYTDKIITPEFMDEINYSGHNLFHIPSQWQKKGALLWDQKSVRSGRLIEYISYGGYKLLVDDRNSTVYAFAYHM